MASRYPGLTQEVEITQDMLTGGLVMYAGGRNYVEVMPNYVILHLALNTSGAAEGTLIIPDGAIPSDVLPQFPERGVLRHNSEWVSVLWRPTGRVEIEHTSLSSQGWLIGKIEAKRRAS